MTDPTGPPSGPSNPTPPPGPKAGDIPHPDPNFPPKPPTPGTPPPPKHLVDSGWKIELLDRECTLLAVARVNDAGVWWLSQRGHEAVYVGGRFGAETVMHELVVA